MTSANVITYTIRKAGQVVGKHSQHMYCKKAQHELLKYQPEEAYTIQRHWADEDEVMHDYEEVPLNDFLKKYREQGRRYRDGCTIDEVFMGPKDKYGLPDINAIKLSRKDEEVR